MPSGEMNPVGNLFRGFSDSIAEELTDVLIQHSDVRIERIVSTGQASPKDFWYDQNEHEWVVVLKGEAELRMKDCDATIRLGVGDHLYIAPHRRHRVESTSPSEPTIWLAVFFQ